MRAVARYSAIFLPSINISNSDTRAHFMLRTVLAASATAFSAALAKLSCEEPTISMTFWAMAASSRRTEVYRFREDVRSADEHEKRARSAPVSDTNSAKEKGRRERRLFDDGIGRVELGYTGVTEQPLPVPAVGLGG